MKSTFNVLFFIRRDKKRKDGTCPIMCRITIDGVESRFNTKVYVKDSRWNVKANRISGNNAESRNLNARLDDIKASLYRIYHEVQRFNVATPEIIKNEFLGFDESGETILDIYTKHIQNIHELIGISITKVTVQRYRAARNHLAEFIKMKYHVSDIAVKSINDMFIRDFEVYLLSQARMSNNTMSKSMQYLKKMINIAINNGFVVHNPFANYKIKFKKVDRGYLTEEELKRLIEKTMPVQRLEQVRDIFVFSCFTGLVYIDVKELTKKHLRTGYKSSS